MPMPSLIQAADGQLALGQDFRVELDGYTEPRLERAAARLTARISRLTGMAIPVPGRAAPQPALIVRAAAAGKPVQQLGEDESYQLAVDARQAIVTAPNPLGALHGMETFFQLIDNGESGWSVPAVRIDDKPRFPWRGLLLDVSRHFMPLDVVRRNLDGMAAVKLNVLHWHLSDDQGFRVESKTAPKLHEAGSDGLYYTQEEIRGIVEYARDRGIRVVPEFDIPGHTQSWLAAYPELSAAPGPVSILRTWGVSDAVMDPSRPETYDFLERVLGELAALFPDEYFHIGGDEVNGKEWGSSTRIADYMKTNAIKDRLALQARFNQRIEALLAGMGKHTEGWDEVLHPDLPRSVVVQSWRGAKSLAEAVRQGFPVLLSSGYYLDHMEPASKLYLVDPLDGEASALSPEQRTKILGGEVCMWGEYVTPENVDSRIWPRTAAVAERFWSPAEIRDVPGMYKRLEAVDAELTLLGLTHGMNQKSMLARLTGLNDIDPLRTLADVTEPGELALRHHVNPNYTQSTPLNRFVDAVVPDSDVARHFGELVDRYLSHHSDTEARDGLRAAMNLWIANDTKVSDSLGKRQVAQDALPVSAMLARIAAEGLVALAALEAEKRLPFDSLAAAQEGEKPVGEVRLAVGPHITRLVAAVTPKTPPPPPPKPTAVPRL
jgi:hexosaminidase